MAVNNSRSMNADFHQGVIDRSYIQLTPDRGGVVENPPIDRVGWPYYRYVEQFIDHSMVEAEVVQATKPVELMRGGNTGDQRF